MSVNQYFVEIRYNWRQLDCDAIERVVGRESDIVGSDPEYESMTWRVETLQAAQRLAEVLRMRFKGAKVIGWEHKEIARLPQKLIDRFLEEMRQDGARAREERSARLFG